MNKETKANLIISIISIVVIIFLPERFNTIKDILINITAGFIGFIAVSAIINFKYLWLIVSILTKRTDYIRFSIAYLYRIQIEDKYLLIKSNRIKDFYQPVGGAYKYFANASDLFIK